MWVFLSANSLILRPADNRTWNLRLAAVNRSDRFTNGRRLFNLRQRRHSEFWLTWNIIVTAIKTGSDERPRESGKGGRVRLAAWACKSLLICSWGFKKKKLRLILPAQKKKSSQFICTRLNLRADKQAFNLCYVWKRSLQTRSSLVSVVSFSVLTTDPWRTADVHFMQAGQVDHRKHSNTRQVCLPVERWGTAVIVTSCVHFTGREVAAFAVFGTLCVGFTSTHKWHDLA